MGCFPLPFLYESFIVILRYREEEILEEERKKCDKDWKLIIYDQAVVRRLAVYIFEGNENDNIQLCIKKQQTAMNS